MEKPKILCSLTTYQKSNALTVLLESLLKNNYQNSARFHIADDNAGKRYSLTREQNPHNPAWIGVEASVETLEMPSAVDVYEQFKDKFDLAISYGKTPRVGIAKQKNRGIQYFMTRTDCDYLVLMDDDMIFRRPGLLEALVQALQDNNLHHISTYWTDVSELTTRVGLSGKSWDQDFPVEALGKGITWHKGCQGILNIYTRQCIKTIGYYDNDWRGRYSYEHAIHSARAHRFVDKRSPLWYAQFIESDRYFIGQAVPNNYFDTATDIALNDPQFHEKLGRLYEGLDGRVTSSGLKEEDETCIY